MQNQEEQINRVYGNKLRVRVCGICIVDDKILMVKHVGIGEDYLWSPPGGGMIYGFSAEENLTREFEEETNISVNVKGFLFINEFLSAPLHAIEIFFETEIIAGALTKGFDPEMSSNMQIIDDVRFLTFEEIRNERPTRVHNIFNKIKSLEDLRGIQRYSLFVK